MSRGTGAREPWKWVAALCARLDDAPARPGVPEFTKYVALATAAVSLLCLPVCLLLLVLVEGVEVSTLPVVAEPFIGLLAAALALYAVGVLFRRLGRPRPASGASGRHPRRRRALAVVAGRHRGVPGRAGNRGC
ncbi:MAG: hypothetical protein M3Q48_00880, partial [Actinomycetota bacterium]|nr:hypothetical protein [Actinomycetota bacterium]